MVWMSNVSNQNNVGWDWRGGMQPEEGRQTYFRLEELAAGYSACKCVNAHVTCQRK